MNWMKERRPPEMRWTPACRSGRNGSHPCRVLVLGVALAGLAASTAHAAITWYVDGSNPSCSDTGPGTSAVPFCTIGQGAKKALSGDTVLVAPSIYREQVVPTKSGAPGSPVTYLAQAPGAVVMGTLDVSDPAGWSPTSTNAWRRSYAPPSTPTQVFKDGVRLLKAASADTTTPDSWFYDGTAKLLYVDIGGPNPGIGHVIEAGARSYGFNLVSLGNVVVDGFDLKNQNSNGVRVYQSTSCTVRNNRVSYPGSYGILVDTCTDPNTVEGNDVSFTASVGIRLRNSNGSTVRGNVAHDNGNTGISLYGSNGNLIIGNTAYRNKRPDARAANGFDINGGSSNNQIEANLAYSNDDSGFQAFNGANGNLFVRNVSRRNGDHGFDTNGSTGTRYVSNTSYKNVDNGINVEGSSINTLLSDNISVDNGLDTRKFDLRVDASSTAGFVSDYDILWDSSTGDAVQYNNVRYSTLDAFAAATGQESHGIGADPLFVDPPGGDLHLRAGSPATDSADASAPGFSSSDFDGRSPVDVLNVADTGKGNPTYADRGAFEYDATPTAALTVTPPSGKAPLAVTADASGSADPDTTPITRYTFDFGDGSVVGPQVEPTATHTYLVLGTFIVTVTVEDTAGLRSQATKTVYVLNCDNPAPNDSVCNGLDDDCDGLVDEDYVPAPTTCGLGACASTGSSSCVNGSVVDTCRPGTPAPDDSVCNGVDDDCDGRVDEDFVSVLTTCGAGTCASTGSTSCVNGSVVDSCQPGTPPSGGDNCEDEVHWTLTGPYSVTFDWRGSLNTIRYGPTSAYGQTITAVAPNPLPFSSGGPFWEARITGLQADALYHYSIGGLPDHTFRTTPPRGAACFTADVEGDVGDSTSQPEVPVIQSQIASDQPRLPLVVGDLTYGDAHGQSHVDQHFNDVMVWSMDAPYMPAWGNHEWDKPSDDLRNYKGRFDFPNPQGSPGAPSAGCCGEDWYWFDYGDVRFIGYPDLYLDATWSDWRSRAETLMDDAQLDPGIRFIVTFGHRPAYSSGHHTGSATLAGYLDALACSHDKYVLNLNGHSHDYERSFPQKGSSCSTSAPGAVHVTVGTGGIGLEEDGPCLWLTCEQPSWSAFRAMHLGFLKLRFLATGIEGLFVCGPLGQKTNDVTCDLGTVIDRFTIGSVPSSDTTCNAVDDDCDGLIDEDYVSQPTNCGVGACASTGVTSCVGGAVQNSCTPGTPAASDATCNGVDDDCDGLIDEDFVSQPTTCGIGACASTGVTSCVGGTVQNSCTPGSPSPEICDGLDNDCNGATDDVPAPVGSPSLSLDTPAGSPTELRWSAVAGATSYDVVRGSLNDLRSSGGDFAFATKGCLANDLAATSMSDPDLPVMDEGFWYLVRAGNCGGSGSYDSGAGSQVGSRDQEIQASGSACP